MSQTLSPLGATFDAARLSQNVAGAQALADVMHAACMAPGDAMPITVVQGVNLVLQRILRDV